MNIIMKRLLGADSSLEDIDVDYISDYFLNQMKFMMRNNYQDELAAYENLKRDAITRSTGELAEIRKMKPMAEPELPKHLLKTYGNAIGVYSSDINPELYFSFQGAITQVQRLDLRRILAAIKEGQPIPEATMFYLNLLARDLQILSDQVHARIDNEALPNAN